MNRNTNAHFANLPGIKIGRSKFDRSFTNKTTMNAADLCPIFVDPDIVPGDTVTMRMSEVVRMMTPIAPVFDNSYLDVYFFFVPNRLIWDDFKKFMGENETAPWTQTEDIQVPQLIMTSKNKNTTLNTLRSVVELGSVLEKMGIPPQTDWTYNDGRELRISALPTRAYCLVWNEFFRSEALQNPVNISKASTDNVVPNTQGSGYISDPDANTVYNAQYGGYPPLKVCKPFDYFTSALPQPQKGQPVSIPLTDDKVPLKLGQQAGIGTLDPWEDVVTGSGDSAHNWTGDLMLYDTSNGLVVTNKQKEIGEGRDNYNATITDPLTSPKLAYLYSDLTSVTGATVSQLRQAFQIQKYYERDARSGTRYIESVKAHFGVQNPDYRLQRPEYLGGFRHNINVNQVVQSTPTENDSTPLGTTGAYSVTSGKENSIFTKSFTEHGVLLGVACIRTDHTYQQGINRAWFKKKKFDFYSPEFASLSEQAILNQEIYAQGTSADKEAFGYQEAWAEMRYMPDMVTGMLRSQYSESLDIWHYGDYYTEKPTLGDKWIKETKANIERTLAVQGYDQFMCDFYFGAIYTRPMPLYSVPGLIDHH